LSHVYRGRFGQVCGGQQFRGDARRYEQAEQAGIAVMLVEQIPGTG